jgi:histidine ammonia-lyase
MGTIAARDCMRNLDLTDQVVAGHLIATLQAIVLRERDDAMNLDKLQPEIREFIQALQQTIPFIDEDRRLDGVLQELISQIRAQSWPLYPDM